MSIPLSLYDLPTLAAALGAEAAPEYECTGCGRVEPPEAFVDTTGLPGELPRWACHTCASHPHRLALSAVAEEERLLAGPDWSAIRARRDVLLLCCDWTQSVDAPLDPETVLAWREYRQQLRDITSYDSPETVTWPTAPA